MSQQPSPRNNPMPNTDVKYTDFIDEAVSATCSRCSVVEFMRGSGRKALADVLRDRLYWRAVEGRLLCFDCIGRALVATAHAEPIRFTFDGCGYVTTRAGNVGRSSYYIEAKRTDGSGGRLIPLDGRALDAVLSSRWRP